MAGMTSGRPVGGAYYLYRTLRRLDLDLMREMLVQMMETQGDHPGLNEGALADRLRSEEIDDLIERLRRELTAEIRRRLVADRGRQPVAATLRAPPLEEVDLMHASESQLRRIEELIGPLTRKLAARLARRDLHRYQGAWTFAVPFGPPWFRWRPAGPFVFASSAGSVPRYFCCAMSPVPWRPSPDSLCSSPTPMSARVLGLRAFALRGRC